MATVKLVVGAMTASLVVATLAFVAVVQLGLYQPHVIELMLLVLAVAWPTITVSSFAAGRIMKKQASILWKQEASSEETLLERYLGATILRAVILEGAGLFGAVVYLLTGELVVLVAPAMSVALLGTVYPTDDRFRGFVRDVTSM